MAQTSAFEVCGLTGPIRHGAPTQAAQIPTLWQWWWCPSLPVGPPPAVGGRLGRGKPRPYIPYLDSTALVPREPVLRHERGATNAPLRVDDCQFALGFESANLRKNYAAAFSPSYK